eukprot:3576789-Heterocapsa_arctica.AAC.1
MAVVLHGVRLDEFLAEWDRVLIHLTDPPAPEVALALFVRQVKDCPKLKTQWDHYYKSSDPNVRCFKYLLRFCTTRRSAGT